MESYTERTLPSPLGATRHLQTEATSATIKFAHRPVGYHLSRKTAQSRTQGSVFFRWLRLIPSVFSHNFISRIRVVEAKPFGALAGLWFLDLTPLLYSSFKFIQTD